MDALALTTVDCRLADAGWTAPRVHTHPTLVFLRAGLLARRARGSTVVLDPSLAYFGLPGDEEQVRHLGEEGHRSTVLSINSELMAELAGNDVQLPSRPFRTSPEVDFYHRRLLAAGLRNDDEAFNTQELTNLLLMALRDAQAAAPGRGVRAETAAARQRAVNRVRELLSAAPPRTCLATLAAAANLSPHHLSRVFREETGLTLGRYRNRIRVRLALNRLADGGSDLSAVAHELGFSDHAHFTRTVRSELHLPPRELRRLLQASQRV